MNSSPHDTGFPNGPAFMKDRFCDRGESSISLFDWGFARSDACFDFLHVWEGYIFRLDDHLDRFFNTLALLRLNPQQSRDEVRSIIIELIRMSGLKSAYVHFGCSRGRPTGTGRDPRTAVNWFYAYITPFLGIFDDGVIERGINLIITDVHRIPPTSIRPDAKNYNRLDMSMSLFEAYDRGGDTCVLIDSGKNIVEGPGFNIFVVKDRKISTPKSNMLPGLTRKSVFELCTEFDLGLEQKNISAEDLRSADEVFITSSAAGILPIAKIDGMPVGAFPDFPVTTTITDTYWKKKGEGWHGTAIR